MSNSLVLDLVVVTALAFDFTNGFHDTGNAMATSIATGALPPEGRGRAVRARSTWSARSCRSPSRRPSRAGWSTTGAVTLTVVFAGLVGGIPWNLMTWYLGIPSSSSHALIGGVVGSTIAAAGGSAVKWHGVAAKVAIPGGASRRSSPASSPRSAPGRSTGSPSGSTTAPVPKGFRIGQIGSASLVSLAHGTNDAQKTMGIITLALIADGSLHAGAKAPTWVIVVLRHRHQRSAPTSAAGGSSAPSARAWSRSRRRRAWPPSRSSAAAILLASHFGYSLSTTHVATGSILGTGIGKKGAEVRWGVAGRMAIAWVFTLPMAGLVGAGTYGVAYLIGGSAGVVILFVALVAICGAIFAASRKNPVHAGNVNEEWTGSVYPETTSGKTLVNA